MKNKNNVGKQTRGWIPNNPKIGIITNSTKDRKKTHRRITLPLSTLGAFMIVPSLLSAIFGIVLVSVYLRLPFGPEGTVFYSGLYAGILSLAAFALGSYSGMLLLAGKHFVRAVTGMAMIFSFGVATLLIPTLEGLPLQSGLIVASPMIASSVIALFITALNIASQKTKQTIQKEPPTTRARIFAGLGAAGGGLTLMGIVFHFTPMYPKQADVVVLIIGIPLLVAAFLVRRTYKH